MPRSTLGKLRIAVGLATAGRAEILGQTLAELARQIRAPDMVIICPASDADKPGGEAMVGLPFPIIMVQGPRGLCAQRNSILRAASDFDLVAFFDDDFFPCRDYVERLEEVALYRPSAVVITGNVLADGATGPGIAPHEAKIITEMRAETSPVSMISTQVHNGYGCNMAVRMAPILSAGLRFDEALPLYGWLEDVDFSRRLVAVSGGEVVRVMACRGVHLGIKSGRMPGVRFGYSQIANPFHIWRKGAISASWALTQVARNLLANFARTFMPEPWVDRRGRLRGNLLALYDLALGRLRPQKILDLG